ncbi:MAG TPA: squalene synthase HpnC [Vicinamibacterales bacterium]|nr:squalene synthase HpnC [Vicinamibacterales bacterium]
MARSHYENFPVASLLLPAAMRPHVAAVYAFARVADDFADEGRRPVEERYRLLDGWLARLHGCVHGAPASAGSGADDRDSLIFLALGTSIRACDLPVSLFEDLLSAFRQDVETRRYRTWADVLDYCRRSANPVGRLVLRIAGYREEHLDRSSDALCTALQLANFWQDFGRDFRAGRLYVPLEDCAAAGAREEDLEAGRLTAPWRAVMKTMTERTRALFDEGRAVCDGVRGRLRFELRFTWLGGSRILDRVDAAGDNGLIDRPALGAVDAPPLVWRALTWKRTP